MSPRTRRSLRTLAACCCFTTLVALADVPEPDCQCRAPDGNPRGLGTVECVTITGHRYLVRCEMSSNNPYWRRLLDSEGCVAA